MTLLHPDPRVARFAARFPSKSDPGRTYDVAILHDGSATCECWPFLERGVCKHVDECRRYLMERKP